MEAARPERGIFELVDLRLGLLQAHDVGGLARKPLVEAFAGCRTYAVRVERDDAHGYAICSALL